MADDVLAKIDEQVKKNKVILFIKGIPEFPQCGFSAHTVDILGEEKGLYYSNELPQYACARRFLARRAMILNLTFLTGLKTGLFNSLQNSARASPWRYERSLVP